MRIVLCMLMVSLVASPALAYRTPMPSLEGYVLREDFYVPCTKHEFQVKIYVLQGYEESIANDAIVVYLKGEDKPLLIILIDWGEDEEYREAPDTGPLAATMFVDRDRDGFVDDVLDALKLPPGNGCALIERYVN